jgi:hypothetical protein
VAPLPRGTVALLFTDIEGSTRLLERLPDDVYHQLISLGHPMSRDALVSSRQTPVSPRNLKRRRMSAAAAPASGKDAR